MFHGLYIAGMYPAGNTYETDTVLLFEEHFNWIQFT